MVNLLLHICTTLLLVPQVLFTCFQAVFCLFSHTLTALLYCPAVARAAERNANKAQVASAAPRDQEVSMAEIERMIQDTILSKKDE